MDPRGLGKDRHSSNGQEIFKQPEQAAVVDASITRKENANLKEYHEAIRSQTSVDAFDLPLRPAYGDKGQPIILLANYLQIAMIDTQQLFTYEAALDERLHNRRQRQQFLETALKSIPELKNLGEGIATDYTSLVVTSSKISLGPSETKTFVIEYYDTEFPEGRVLAKGKPFQLDLSLAGTISSADLSRYIMSGTADSSAAVDSEPADTKAVRTLNIVMQSHPNKEIGVYQGGRNKFFHYPTDLDIFNNFDLLGGLIAVRGYYSSVRFSTSRTLLNLNAQCSPFYKSINVHELIQLFQKMTPGNWQASEHFLKRLRIKTSYIKGSDGSPIRKVKTVNGLSHKMEQDPVTKKPRGNADFNCGNALEIKFKRAGRPLEGPVSVQDYFQTEYGLTLSHPTDCVLNCGTEDNPVWIPPELCTVMPGQPYRGPLNEIQLARIITIAARPPAENASRITAADGGLGMFGVLPSTCGSLGAFGITVNPKMIAVPARILPAPRVIYARNMAANPVNGSWNMRDKKVLKPATLPTWTILRIGPGAMVNVAALKQYYDALTATFKSCGLEVGKLEGPPGLSIPALNDEETEKKSALDKPFIDGQLREKFEKCRDRNIGILLVVLSSTTSWIRERVKFWGDKEYGIHTSCVQIDRLKKMDPNYSANVALKINLKLGGINQCISPTDLGFLKDGKTMLVGMDVTHPAPGTTTGTPSIAGVVASIDAAFGQWPGSISCQESKKEIVSNLDTMIEERLECWISKNPGKKLENILIYRDGVSEGQYMTVQRHEIPAIRQACLKVFKDTSLPKITFLIVGKNHHTRFYPTEKKHADQRHNCNIKNGTVVDRGITMPKGWDFFMAAHAALQGTTKPAHYVVLLDEIKLGANELEKITHNLCYLQGRATKAVSVCPPAYYAHLICLRARCYLADYISRSAGKEFDWNNAPWRSGVHEKLNNSMFYI